MPFSSQTMPYFPPPPTSAGMSKSKSRFVSTTTIITPSSSQPKPERTPLATSRTYILPLLLVTTSTIFILAIIYGYCVVKPHTQLTAQQLASNTTTELDSSIFSRSPTATPDYNSRITQSSTSSSNNAMNSPLNTSNSDRPTNNLTASLIFYLLTSPITLLLILTTEVILHYTNPTTLLTRRFHYTLLFTHILSLVTFILSASFWTACELPSPSTTSTLHVICPAQVRGHFMYGIHELSIAKTVLVWVVVAGLLWHVTCMLRCGRESRRKWAVDCVEEKEKNEERGTIKIGMEPGVVEPAKDRKRDRIVRFLR